MKYLPYSEIRMTDDLERELLQEALRAQQSEAMSRAIKQFFRKLFHWVKTPKPVSTAH